ncbi:MAG: haloacid dehalogenase [Candidatus Tectimicrobiota bacterium]|nr:MAG: haloacid dehalogenase [Candidatus Tectomicrobia bacterium]
MAIAAILCDYGNVLVHTRDPRPRAAWEQRLGLAPGALTRLVHNDTSWLAAQRGDLTAEAHWQAVGQALALTAEELAALRQDFYRGDAVNEALLARLIALRQAGYRTAILSNFSTELRQLLARQGLLPHFEVIAVSAELGVMKPEAAAYTAALRLLALPPAACVFIDDQPLNVAAAQQQGLHGILFRDTALCLKELDCLLQTDLTL